MLEYESANPDQDGDHDGRQRIRSSKTNASSGDEGLPAADVAERGGMPAMRAEEGQYSTGLPTEAGQNGAAMVDPAGRLF